MARFTIDIQCNNAAFHDDDGDFDPAAELVRLLSEIAGEINMQKTEGHIREINGNKVGFWRIEE